MIQKAVVKKIIDGNKVAIEVQRQSACGHDCAKCGGCGVPLERIQAVADNPVGARVGDTVTIEGESRQIMKMAAVVYMIPLVLFFVFFAAARLLGAGEGIAGLAGGAGFLFGVLGAVHHNKVVKERGNVTFTIIKIG